MGKKLSYGAIRALGISSIIGVSALTGFTVKMAIDDANNRADASYKSAMSSVQTTEAVTTTVPVLTTEAPVTTTEVVTETTVATTVATTVETIEVTTEAITEATTEPVVTEPTEVTTEPAIDDGSKIQPPDDHDTSSVVETPEDLGYDLTNVIINDDGRVAYIIQPGDCLSRIACRYGYTVSQLAAANPYITNVNLIYSGNQVVLPCDDAFVEYVRAYKK